jgi:bifunctional non-homologous end joining protein LigD
LAIRAQLAAAGLVSFVRTTGGKGLHVVAPIERTVDWDVLKAFAKAVADAVVHDAPDHYTATVTKSKRVGRIFIDYLRNSQGATAIASWSVRARPGAGVAVPIAWEELAEVKGGDAFGVAEAGRRLSGPDPWAGFGEVRQRLPPGVKRRA